MENKQFQCLSFDQLHADTLYEILQLRQQVFVLEQQCFYADIDGVDTKCFHLWGLKNGKVISTARLVPPGIVYAEPSIGRVCTSVDERKSGEGKKLMEKAIFCCQELFGKMPIKIGAQLYLERFYNDFGFDRISAPYNEDGILHIQMLRVK